MARRKIRTRTVYRTVRRGYRSRKGILGGSMNNLMWGAIGGILAGMIPNVFGKWTKPAVLGAGGYFLKKPQLITLAGAELGKMVVSGGLFGGGSTQNSFWES